MPDLTHEERRSAFWAWLDARLKTAAIAESIADGVRLYAELDAPFTPAGDELRRYAEAVAAERSAHAAWAATQEVAS